MHDVHEAGGVPAIINELMKKDGTLHPDRITVTGKTLRENNEGKEIKNFDVIHPLDAPYDAQGGLSILFGNKLFQLVNLLNHRLKQCLLFH